MPDDTRKLQKDPPEGSREVVEQELERQADKYRDGTGDHGRKGKPPATDGRAAPPKQR